jgi:hypothetical protein
MMEQSVNGPGIPSGPAEPSTPSPAEPSTPSPAEPSTPSPAEPSTPSPPEQPGAEADVEIVDGVPVLAEVRTVERASPASLPAVQAAAVAATGFVAGAATVALVMRRAARKPARTGRVGPRRPAAMLPIVATRSFLVDVHVIAKPGD